MERDGPLCDRQPEANAAPLRLGPSVINTIERFENLRQHPIGDAWPEVADDYPRSSIGGRQPDLHARLVPVLHGIGDDVFDRASE